MNGLDDLLARYDAHLDSQAMQATFARWRNEAKQARRAALASGSGYLANPADVREHGTYRAVRGRVA